MLYHNDRRGLLFATVLCISVGSQLTAALAQTPTGVINTVIGGNNGDGQTATNAIIDPQGIEARGQIPVHQRQ
jgi:hypothetical protein